MRLQHGWVGWGWSMPCIVLGSFFGWRGGHPDGRRLVGHRSVYIWGAGACDGGLVADFHGRDLPDRHGRLLFYFPCRRFSCCRQTPNARRPRRGSRCCKSQLEPHMLFNTLAHLRVLIKLRPDDAQAMLDELIAYLRATLQSPQHQPPVG